MRDDLFDAVGRTPLVRLPALSDALGRTIVGKAEFMNPGGSVKDRAAKGILVDAEISGRLAAGGTVVEGTAGNTGIALALLGNSRGYRTIIVIPDDQSQEKIALLRALGADVRVVPAVPFTDDANYYHVARRTAEAIPGSLWADQFNNAANWRAHYTTTGPEIFEETGGQIRAFVCACGTGGTFAGVSHFLKERDRSIRTIVADPMGSAMYEYVRCGTLGFAGDSVSEGIGIKRVTENFKAAEPDDAIRVDDRTMIEMAHYLVRAEGMFLGGSAALNVAAAARVSLDLARGSVVATVLCDGGARYMSRLYNASWLAENALEPASKDLSFL